MAVRYLLEIGDPVTHRFSSAVRNEINQTNATYPDSIGDPILYPVRLVVPKLNQKISDSISGSVTIPQYKVEILNKDGKYDDVETLGWFNTRAVVKRSDKVDPTLADFDQIFSGIIDYPNVVKKSVMLVINNTYRSLTEQVCDKFEVDATFPNLPDSTKDKNIPIAYGPDNIRVQVLPVDTTDATKYFAIDNSYLTSVDFVYDSDGNSIAFSVDGNGIITATDADSADVAGATGNTIGDICTSEIALKSGIAYNADNWDKLETDDYIGISGNLNFYFSGGTVRQLIDAALKSDNAFLFTKNDGRLTMRQWGRNYVIHELQSWVITGWPNKNYQDALRYYNSTAIIQYQLNHKTNRYEMQIASGTTPAFDKEREVPYKTDLYVEGQVTDLGDRLIKRFGTISEIINLAIGKSAFDINLLDEVQIDVTINGRQVTDKTKWIVREGDPGQDVLSLEAKSGFVIPEVIDGILSQPGSHVVSFIDGVRSQPFAQGLTGQVNSQPITVTGEE